jgi:hypothetical protein
MLKLSGKTMCSLHLNIGVSNTNQICNKLYNLNFTILSAELSIVLNASIFQRAKSPGNYYPNIDLADMILIELALITLCVLGKYLRFMLLTIYCCTQPIPWLR